MHVDTFRADCVRALKLLQMAKQGKLSDTQTLQPSTLRGAAEALGLIDEPIF